MKLWKLSQYVNNGYDTYDSVIVAAETENQARLTMPNDYYVWGDYNNSAWANDPNDVEVELIGVAVAGIEAGVILASFNAG